jgi:methionyl-tRNA synthetase
MAEALGVAGEMDLNACGVWGRLVPGAPITPGAQLFPRLQREEKEKPQPPKNKAMKEPVTEKAPSPEAAPEAEGIVTFDAFQKLELRVAEIIAAEKIAKSDRLLKLTVKAPEERTIVAGIAQHYQPEELIGRQVIIVANLKPAKLMGVASHGMVLAAKEGDRLVLSALSGPVAPGSRVA